MIRWIAKMEIAGPGYINIWLSETFMAERIGTYLEKPFPGVQQEKKMKCIVDFSSPNIAKEMHVGHLRSTIIGDTLCRVLEYVGHEVQRINHVGDWGTQFGMLIAHLKESFPDFLTSDTNIGDLQAFYKASKKRFDEEPDFKKRAHEEVVKLQSGNEENIAAWKMFCAISRNEFQKIYDRLDVVLEERGESFYNALMPPMVKELTEQGHVRLSDGATCFFIPGKEVPLMIRKTDGGFTYDTTDMAAIRYRIDVDKADWLIYVTDAGQADHFELIFAAARIAGWVKHQRIDHVPFGVVLGEDKKKFKTRSGDTVRLVDLLDEAKDRCKKELEERKVELSSEEMEKTAAAMGYGAVKYFDLNKNRLTNYVFSYDAMCDLKGDTALYLLYAAARILSIIRNAPVPIEELKKTAQINLIHPSEIALGVHMLRFPDIVEQTLDTLLPNKLTDYLYQLCALYSIFYRDCHVIGVEHQSSRLLLCEAVLALMTQIFHLLGIRRCEKL